MALDELGFKKRGTPKGLEKVVNDENIVGFILVFNRMLMLIKADGLAASFDGSRMLKT